MNKGYTHTYTPEQQERRNRAVAALVASGMEPTQRSVNSVLFDPSPWLELSGGDTQRPAFRWDKALLAELKQQGLSWKDVF